MFIDRVKIYVKAGNGGNGCQSFYQDRFTRHKIPDGGDGGRGGDIILQADRNLHTLLDFRYRRHFFSLHGKSGSSGKKKGKDAPCLIIKVPCGTIVKDASSGCILQDLEKDGQQVIVAKGGQGGSGNRHRQEATGGKAGEEREILLDLKLISDVGIVGFPNAGKSTLLSNISSAHPKIAAYPFTTRFPVLGVVTNDSSSFVIADIPGLIKDSSKGKGLGHDFLRHIERTKIILHLVDMSGSEGRDPIQDYKVINKELKEYSPHLYKKPQIIVANKMDLEPSAMNLERFREVIKKKVYPISALKKEGLEEVIEAIKKRLQ
ncbi:MAG: GTPase ObgE [Candidatus Omnitrophica bacterium]|nr:GTPase ObgE [Candidatus Omnitrophota bacterium]